MDNFIFLPTSSKVSAGNSATGALSVALGQNCIASGDYSFAMGKNCLADTSGAFAAGIDCVASGTGGDVAQCVAMGYKNRATGCQSVAMGYDCSSTGCQSVALGAHSVADTNIAFAMGLRSIASGFGSVAFGRGSHASASFAVAMGSDCSATGICSFADGSGCVASGVCSVALGRDADASGTGGFVYRSNAGNTFVFDDAGPSLKINGSAVGGAAALSHNCLHHPEMYDANVAGTNLVAVSSFAPNLPNDARLVSVTAWGPGASSQCGGGVTFDIPSSDLRSLYWGGSPTVGAFGLNYLKTGNANFAPTSSERGFRFTNGSDCGVLGSGGITGAGPPLNATNVQLWNVEGGAGGGSTAGGRPKVPGAASAANFLSASGTSGEYTGGMKITWIG